MKKALIIILVIALLISSFEVFATCSGTCTACSTYSTQSSCTSQGGCSWDPAGPCSGTPNACNTYSSQSTCTACGCTWFAFGGGICVGFSSTACNSFGSQNTCTACGCSWDAANCYGTCTACSSYADQSGCESQDGCSWEVPAYCGDDNCDPDEDCDSCPGDCLSAGQVCCDATAYDGDCCTDSDCSGSDTCENHVCTSPEAYCGDGNCDGNEDCSCSDCEGEQDGCSVNYFCSGGSCVYSGAGGTCIDAGGTCKSDTCSTYSDCQIASGSCTTGYCCSGSCTTKTSKCGNDICETGETCVNCETDCGSCIEEALTLSFRSPVNRDILKRGTHILKVIVFFGRRPSSSAKVTAESLLFPAKITLYDDGGHKDEKQFDGIYANEFTIGKDVNPGEYTIKVTAEKDKSRTEETIKITLDPIFNVYLSSFQNSYVKGERITFDGKVEYHEEPVQDVNVKLQLERLGDILYQQNYKTGKFGQFSDSYLISFADPDGDWILNIEAEDEDGNRGNLKLGPRIGTPEGVAYYSINFLSPVKGSSYPRGEDVPITIEVSEEGREIQDAEVTFLSPKGEYLKLVEGEPGVYTTNYKVSFDDPLDRWRLAVQAVKKTAEATRAGGNTIPIKIEPGKIKLEVLSPTEETIFTGTELDYEIKATYPDDSLVRGAKLKLELSNNQTIELLEEKPGIYTTKYFVSPKDLGSLDAKIFADDRKGNIADIPSVLLYVKERTIIELGLVLLYQNVIRPYWWAILAFLIISGMLYKPTFDVKMLKRSLRNAKQEQATVKAMQMEAEREYYKRKTINKTDFRRLIQQYKERLAKAREQQNIAEEKLKKKLEAKRTEE